MIKKINLKHLKFFLLLFLIITIPIIIFKNTHISNKKKNQLNESKMLDHLNENKINKILVEKVKIQKQNQIFKYSGILDIKNIIEVKAQTDGIIEKIFVSQGDVVHKGQLLIKLNEAEKKSNLERAEQSLKQRSIEIENNKKLFNDKIISRVKLEESFTAYKAAVSDFEKAKKDLDFTNIKSNIDGYVDVINAKIGDYINPVMPNYSTSPENTNILIKIFDENSFFIKFFIPKAEIFSIKHGQRIILNIEDYNRMIDKDSLRVAGEINFISNIADDLTRMYKSEATISPFSIKNLGLIKLTKSAVDLYAVGEIKDMIHINDSHVFLYDDGSLIIKVLDQKNNIKFIKVKPGNADVSNDEEKTFFILDENYKNFVNNNENTLNLIVRGGGFIQENDIFKQENIEYLSD
jgi:RND family efflux transporter MFP subunit